MSKAIDILKTDILDRDSNTFVRIRKTGRLEWEKIIPEGSSFSDLFVGLKGEELFKRAYKAACDLLVSMALPTKVNLQLHPSSSFTDGVNICANTSSFDDADMSEGQKLDAFLGYVVHEGCHVLYTDFSAMGVKERIISDLENILEDERIERRLGDEKPGIANFLAAAKYHAFGKYAEHSMKDEKGLQPCVRLLNAILSYIRYPKCLSEATMEEFSEELLKIREIILDFPKTQKHVETAAAAIYEVIKDYFKKNEEKSEGEGEGEGEDGESDASDSSESKSSKEKTNSSVNGTDSKESSKKKIRKSDKQIAKELSEALEHTLDKLEKVTGSKFNMDKISKKIEEDEIMAHVCEGVFERGTVEDVIVRKMPEDERIYKQSLYEVNRYVPVIAKALRGHTNEYKQVYRGMKSGALDTAKLAEAYQGVQTVYIKEGQVKSDSIAVSILIDESGSMIREGRMPAARNAAILINEALKKVPAIESFIYGHTADSMRTFVTELNVYKEPGYSPRYALGSAQARDNNYDGKAILEVANRVARMTNRKHLMFIISDGVPAASGYTGQPARDHVKSVVQQLERKGVYIVQISINSKYDPKLMFTNSVVFTENLSEFAPALAKLIKNTITKNTTRHNA